MTSKEKFEKIEQITVQDVIEWLDGCAVSFVVTEKNFDSIDNQYCSKKVHTTIFSKDRYNRVNLSNGWWMDNTKPFISEFEKKKGKYWKTLSKNSVRKCDSVGDMIRMIIRVFAPYLHFKIDGRSYDYINIKSLIAKDGCSVYKHNKSEEIQSVRSKILELEKEKKQLESRLKTLEYYQTIHEDIQQAVSENFYRECKHYL